jgi:DNA-binding IclR family transcriptional regulator
MGDGADAALATRGENAGQGVQVIARAASVLRVLEAHPEGLSLAQIAKEARLARSTVQRIVSALVSEELLAPSSAGGGVRIGAGVARLAAAIGDNVADLLRPELRRLCAEVEETVDLGVLSSGSVVFIDQIQGSRRLLAISSVGARFPLHCTANGKAILACYEPAAAHELIRKSVHEHQSHPLEDENALMGEIEEVRRTHVAFDLEEHAPGVSAVGVAVLDARARPIAVSIPAPERRFIENRDELVARILELRARAAAFLAR